MTAFPKTNHYRDPALLALARGRECVLRVPGICNRGETVACHSNAGVHGKGKAIKAHDWASVWGCARCHNWLDASFSASGDRRREVFEAAHIKQLEAWKQIEDDTTEPLRHNVAATKALAAYKDWANK